MCGSPHPALPHLIFLGPSFAKLHQPLPAPPTIKDRGLPHLIFPQVGKLRLSKAEEMELSVRPQQKQGLDDRKVPCPPPQRTGHRGPGCLAPPSKFLTTATATTQPRWPLPQQDSLEPSKVKAQRGSQKPSWVTWGDVEPGEAWRPPYFTALDYSEMQPLPSLPQTQGPIPYREGRRWGWGQGLPRM